MSENHGLDTDEMVCFYEQDFYVLSNFSSFRVSYGNIDFDTSEHAYHWQKFNYYGHPDLSILTAIRDTIENATSAHDAFKIAERWASHRNPAWDDIKIATMKNILIAKVNQHKYVQRKLIQTGNRLLVENSWRDSFWGWGADRQGHNHLGKLWMEIRAEIVAQTAADEERKKQNEEAFKRRITNLKQQPQNWEKVL